VLRHKHLVLIIYIGSVLIVVVNDFHNEWNESVYKYIPASVIIAPDLEEVEEFIGKATLTVIVSEKFKQLWCDLRCHLSNNILI
jgi:hypothetical protein